MINDVDDDNNSEVFYTSSDSNEDLDSSVKV